MVRAVRLVRPLYAIVENVAALLGRGMGTVLGDLAESGYDTEWDCIPACAVGAEHERDRVFVVAYPNGPRQLQSEGCEQAQWGRAGNGPQQTAADAHRARRAWWLQTGANSKDAGSIEPRLRFAIGNATQVSRDYWAHQPVLGRGFHGVPNRLDRIAALGNAVVPQIPELIGRAILAAEAA
jgi:DNA (cytosine-5)-methyltransferase 1